MIIKYYQGEKFWPVIFCVGSIACEMGGIISNTAFEKMKSEGILKEIDAVEIIELFFKHVPLISDIRMCKYYEIKK